MDNESVFKRFLVSARQLVNQIPRFSSAYSNKIYDNHQKMIILIFRQKMKMTYREIVKFFKFSTLARALLKLTRIPHHSTLVKFHNRTKTTLLNSLLCKKKARIAAIDASVFQTNHMSYHYANVWNRKDKRKYRRYLKVSIAIDTDTQYILSHMTRLGPRNDHIDFESVMKEIKCDFVVADRGYDSKSNRYFVLRNLGAIPQIPYRKNSSVLKFRGYRKKLEFNEKIYHQRSKVETVFSVIKRKYGNYVLSRSFESQKKEIILRMIAYNIDRKIIITIEVFRVSPKPFLVRFIIIQSLYSS